MKHWYLPCYAPDGGEGGATGDGGQGDAAPAVPENAGRRKRKENPLANVKYGIGSDANVVTGEMDEIGGAGAAQGGATGEQPTGEDFDSLIKGRYKEEYGKRVEGIVQERLKGAKQREAEYSAREAKYGPIMQALGAKYGLDPGDLDGIGAKVAADDDYLQNEAIEQGLTVEQLRTMKKLENENRTMRQAQESAEREERLQAHFNVLFQQAEEAKKLYPNLDLREELGNPEFARLTSPGVRVDVRTAYEIVHRDELTGRQMQIGTQQAEQRIAASVAANRARPKEGQAAAASPAAKTDPTTLTKADRAEIRRRVMAGDRTISF